MLIFSVKVHNLFPANLALVINGLLALVIAE